MIHNFRQMFPSLANQMLGYIEVNDFEMLIKLEDGTKIIYDDFNKSYRNVPDDSHDMTEAECRKEFGIRLRKMLERKGMSQFELSERTGISAPDICHYVNGKSCPSFYRIDKIAKALGCSVDDFRYC